MPRHDGGVHGGEIDFGHVEVEARRGHEAEAALVDGEQLPRGLEAFRFALAPGMRMPSAVARDSCMEVIRVPGEARAARCRGIWPMRLICMSPARPDSR